MDQQTVRDHFAKYEGNFSYMYLDSRDNVTVGIGHLLSTVQDAQALNFIYRKDQPELKAGQKGGPGSGAKKGDAAGSAAITADYARVVAKAGLGYRAQAFDSVAELELSSDDVNALLDQDVASFEAQLPALFPDFSTYPPAAQLALLDLIYNLGRGGLKKFVVLGKAVKKKDWKTASENCHRQGVPEARNKDTKDLFLVAVAQQKLIDFMAEAWNRILKIRPRFLFPAETFDTLIRQRSVPPR
jgi:GH24 family phage-related lysozyme (muramidase)